MHSKAQTYVGDSIQYINCQINQVPFIVQLWYELLLCIYSHDKFGVSQHLYLGNNSLFGLSGWVEWGFLLLHICGSGYQSQDTWINGICLPGTTAQFVKCFCQIVRIMTPKLAIFFVWSVSCVILCLSCIQKHKHTLEIPSNI